MGKSNFLYNLITLSLSLTLASLFYLVNPEWLGIVLASIITILGIYCCFTDKIYTIPPCINERHTTMMFNIFLLVTGAVSFFVLEKEFRTFSILGILSGLLGIIYWFTDKRYVGKNIKQILLNECHIMPPEAGLTTAAIVVINALVHKSFTTTTLILSIVFLIDAISQFIYRKKRANN